MDPAAFQKHLVLELLKRAEDTVRPFVTAASKTLAAYLTHEVGPLATDDGSMREGQGRLYIPHYWAVYVHDGRAAFGPKRGVYLCWFKVAVDDPRLQTGYPVREGDVKYLRQVWSRKQFTDALKENRRRQASGEPPFMILTRFHPGSPPKKFFEEPLAGFDSVIRDMVRERFEAFAQPFFLKDRREARTSLSASF